jgi:hypothetical protein
MKVVREVIGADAAADLTILRRKTIESLAVKAGYPPEEGKAQPIDTLGDTERICLCESQSSKCPRPVLTRISKHTQMPGVNSRVTPFLASLPGSAVSSGAMAVFLRERNNVELFDGVQGEI